MGIAETIERGVTRWQGVEVKPHLFNGVEVRVNRHEIGHVDWDRLADLAFPAQMRQELVAKGRARLHNVLPETGWVSYPIRGEKDVEGALELFRLNYERITARGADRSEMA